MSAKTNTDLVRDYLQLVWNEGRVDLAGKHLAEDLVQHNPNLPDGSAAVVAFVEGFRQQVPQGRFEIRRTAEDGDLVFVHSLFTTHDGDRGMAVVDVFRIVDGRIAEHWDVKESVPENSASGNAVV